VRRRTTLTVVPILATLAIVLCACTSTEAATTPTPGSLGREFPAKVAAANGTVTIPSRPTRIMSLSASATAMLYDMGAGSQVVAVDKYSTNPANAPRTPLTGYETGPESYVRYHPDLVILAQDQNGTLSAQLADIGIPALVLPAAANLDDTYKQIAVLGKATGHLSAAAEETSSIKTQLAAIVRSVGSKGHGVTYYQELDPTLYTATSDTFIGALYKSLGMVNIADGAIATGNDYPQLSAESLIEASPEDVFLADGNCCGQTAATFAARPGYSTIRAVRQHHVFVIPDSIASQWGPGVVTFLRMVADDLTGSPTAHGS
jgi:cobalamin transport system substrate-binding protein